MDELIDFAAMAAQVDAACPRPDPSKGGHPPYATEVVVRLVFIQSLYNLSDEECEYQVAGPHELSAFLPARGRVARPGRTHAVAL